MVASKKASKKVSKKSRPAAKGSRKPPEDNGAGDFKDILSKKFSEEDFEEAKRDDNAPPDIPNGQYKARINSASVGSFDDQKTEEVTPFVAFNFTIAAGAHEGAQPRAFHAIRTKQNLQFVTNQFGAIGFPIDEITGANFAETFEDMADQVSASVDDGGQPLVIITVKNRMYQGNRYQNVRIKKPAE